jgi:aminomethyltransferase
VHLDKADFVGQEALRHLASAGRPVRRVGLLLSGRRVAREGHSVLAGGDVVGTVTSGSFSPTLQQPIAMAYVPESYAQSGTSLQVDIRGRIAEASVVDLPFYSRSSAKETSP